MGHIAEALKKAKTRHDGRHGICSAAATGSDTLRPSLPDALNRLNWLDAAASENRASPLDLEATHTAPPAPVTWDVDPSVVVGRQSESSLSEQYRAVRTWLQVRLQSAKHSVLAITSSVPREGKSVTSANLAIVMTEVRRMKVLVVDGDMRQGSLARLLRIEQSPGLADVLAGRTSLSKAILRSPIPNLDILPAGKCMGVNPTELLNSAAAGRAFGEIRDRYHVSLVDTPPVQRVSDVGVIGPLCSGVLFVVRMHKTASHLVRQSLHWLQSNNLNVMGCIATACSQRDTIYTYRPGLDGG